MPTINERLLDSAIRHQVGLSRRASGLLAELLIVAEEAEAEAIALLAGVEREGPKLNRALAVIRQVYDARWGDVAARLTAYASELCLYEAEFAYDGLRRVLPRAAALRRPGAAALQASARERPLMGRTIDEWADGLPGRAYARVADTARQGFAEGADAAEVIRRVRGTRVARRRDGATWSTRRALETLTRTATNSLACAAREVVYAANPDLVAEVAWVSSLDSGTTGGCGARDGSLYEVGVGPRPAAHWNCRSFVVAVVRSWTQAGLPAADLRPGEREAMDGRPARRVTFAAWVLGLSAEDQDEVLGPRRARLFRAGLFSVGGFVDSAGRTYTLDQLRAKDRASFDAVS